MKKIFLIFVLFAFLVPSFGQVRHVVDLSTISNSVDETFYFNFRAIAKKDANWKTIDSIVVSIRAMGELDMDSLTFYGSNLTDLLGETYRVDGSTVMKNFTVTLNLAAATAGFENLYVSNASLTASDLRGFNSLKGLTRGATSGNDATDPNDCWIVFDIYGSP